MQCCYTVSTIGFERRVVITPIITHNVFVAAPTSTWARYKGCDEPVTLPEFDIDCCSASLRLVVFIFSNCVVAFLQLHGFRLHIIFALFCVYILPLKSKKVNICNVNYLREAGGLRSTRMNAENQSMDSLRGP
nr:MAG TPA: hypothetical protein [Bacteriophage sp.]